MKFRALEVLNCTQSCLLGLWLLAILILIILLGVFLFRLSLVINIRYYEILYLINLSNKLINPDICSMFILVI
jgi:hypothetical protein